MDAIGGNHSECLRYLRYVAVAVKCGTGPLEVSQRRKENLGGLSGKVGKEAGNGFDLCIRISARGFECCNFRDEVCWLDMKRTASDDLTVWYCDGDVQSGCRFPKTNRIKSNGGIDDFI